MDTELERIIKQLIEKTKNGEVIWNKTATPNQYSLSLNTGKLSTHLYNAANNLIPISKIKMVECVVENLKGDVVLRASTTVDSEDGALLYSLYDAAYRAYTGKDEVIAGIMKQLESSGQIGKEEDVEDIPF
jgi:hypothetical protein